MWSKLNAQYIAQSRDICKIWMSAPLILSLTNFAIHRMNKSYLSFSHQVQSLSETVTVALNPSNAQWYLPISIPVQPDPKWCIVPVQLLHSNESVAEIHADRDHKFSLVSLFLWNLLPQDCWSWRNVRGAIELSRRLRNGLSGKTNISVVKGATRQRHWTAVAPDFERVLCGPLHTWVFGAVLGWLFGSTPCGVVEISIPDGVYWLRDGCFKRCKSLRRPLRIGTQCFSNHSSWRQPMSQSHSVWQSLWYVTTCNRCFKGDLYLACPSHHR